MRNALYTIGHSNHPIDVFIGLLQRYKVACLVDVRSRPYSKHHPHFNMEPIRRSLQQAGMVYLFLGKELGGRSDNPECYIDGKVRYELIAREPCFREGLTRVLKSLECYRIALMCAEGDPLRCHRTILVGRELQKRSVELYHILPDGSLERHQDTEKRLLASLDLLEAELFRTPAEIIADAYLVQSQRIGHSASEGHR